tara:strand:- start:5493 stop:7193 length:1701 start_codon:yes stop_codon:yes gene_type:complete
VSQEPQTHVITEANAGELCADLSSLDSFQSVAWETASCHKTGRYVNLIFPANKGDWHEVAEVEVKGEESSCLNCPAKHVAPAASTSADACVLKCEANEYFENVAEACASCPASHESPAGSTSPAACELSCAANSYRDGLLQIDFYTGFTGRTWANAKAHAESLHGRLPTNQEMIDYAQFHGGFATHGWIATASSTASAGKDFIYVDNGGGHAIGDSHVEMHDGLYGYPSWGDDAGADHGWFTHYAVATDLSTPDQDLAFCRSCGAGTDSYEGSHKTCTQDNLVYDFGALDLTGTNAEKLAIWTAYAETFGATVELNNWAEYSTGISGPYGSGTDGFVSVPLPTGYNRVQVQYRDIHRSSSGPYALNILLDGVLVDSHNCCDGETMNIGTCCNYRTFETEYTPGQVLKICEDCVGQAWDGAINPDLKITFFNTRTCDTMCFDSSITPVKVTFSITFGGSVTAADLNEGRKQSIKIRIAKSLKVATGAVDIKAVHDARRRLLAVTMDVEISAETDEQAAEFSAMEADIVSATEEAVVDSGLDTTVSILSSCEEGVSISYWAIRKSICP